MDSYCNSGENSSHCSEDLISLNSFKAKIFSNSYSLFNAQIQKFYKLISSNQISPTEFADSPEDVKYQSQIIVGIINKFREDVAAIPHMSALLNPIKKLSDVFEHNMGKSMGNKYVLTDKLKLLYHMTQMKQTHINDISDELDEIKFLQSKFAKDKNAHINRTLEKIRLARENLEKDVFNLIVRYEGVNAIIADATTSQMSSINQKFREISKKFQMTLAMHKTEEKTLTHRKQKLDLQLAQWIEKYDIEIGDREEELQRLIQRYDDASTEFFDLELTMNKHEILYNQSVLERTTEEKRIFEMKLRALMCARAAKTLQRAWRAHRAQQKRKKRKGGKRKNK